MLRRAGLMEQMRWCSAGMDKKQMMAKVQELRRITSAGLMDCKKALVGNEWEIDGAIEWLKERGIAKADKTKRRTAANGLVGVGLGEKGALVYELNSESDFVAKTDGFIDIFKLVQKQAENLDLTTAKGEEEVASALRAEPTIGATLVKGMATTGEKHHIRRALFFPTLPDTSYGFYIHNKSSYSAAGLTCALVQLTATPALRNPEALQKAATQVSQHIVAESLSSEKDTPLREQNFMQTEKTVGGYLKGMAKQAGCKKIEIGQTLLWRCGEGIEVGGDSFADEVAKMVKSA
eukprot:TRINITY_DN17593_c0_g1_i1.p1 TRINITY_DN17593_c0_g1~~TRINITY_DN17593_c0_g1_i1.p1  ORF type:complete len:292 (+),score=89.43 TRINITY_DN17593_c0_g1_i1:51-926(+)